MISKEDDTSYFTGFQVIFVIFFSCYLAFVSATVTTTVAENNGHSGREKRLHGALKNTTFQFNFIR